MKGYRADEILGQHFSVFYTADARDSNHPAEELACAVAEDRYEEEGWRVRKDGSYFWANVVITALRDASGTLRGFGKVTRDMTRRRQAEEALRQLNRELQERTLELTQSNKELEAFSYSVAHDLRAPLRSIDGFSQALLEDYSGKLDADGQKYLDYVRESAQQMARLIDDLLTLSQVTRGELRREDVDLTGLARAAVARLQRNEPERRVECVAADGMVVHGDPPLLSVMLENLIGNAWKFTRQRLLARIEVGVQEQNGRRVYFVRDNGVGFDMTYADKLFGVFQRLHSAADFEGTGIGLATVDRIVRRQGGQVWAEGAVGQGATFYFTFEEESP
jgi:PAS domain S-box-containing protein